MADFKPAMKKTLWHETGGREDGGLWQDPRGDWTRWGISQRWLNSAGIALDARELTRDQAVELYRVHFWDQYKLGCLAQQCIAEEVFDWTVLAGPRAAALTLQRALRSVAAATGNGSLQVEEDGVLGPITRRAANQAPLLPLLAALKSEQAGYARDLDDPRFQKGWVGRAYA